MAHHRIIMSCREKERKLAELNTTMAELCPCSLRDSATTVVPGEGNACAKLLFIGEAPGKKEDETGRPFVGAAGKFLDELLASISIRREDVYITNVVKYRPPNNRDPLPQEVEDCWPWLQQQIAIIDPVLILPLGRHALERFVPNARISRDHGTAFRRTLDGCGTRVFYALYHPAAALYNGALRKTLFDDIRKVPKLLQTLSNHH